MNRAASAAEVSYLATDLRSYRFRVEGPGVRKPLLMTLDQLRGLPLTTATVPISCVEGWSVTRTWEGVRVRDLLKAAGARPGASVTVESVEANGLYRTSQLNPDQAQASNTLLAFRVNGETINVDHGYPVRLIAPNRPGVLQTKWVHRLVIT